jgi:hypothetical protein
MLRSFRVNISRSNVGHIPRRYCNIVCSRCGRNNHLVGSCYAKTHFRGYVLPVLPVVSNALPVVSDAVPIKQVPLIHSKSIRYTHDISPDDMPFLSYTLKLSEDETIMIMYLPYYWDYGSINKSSSFICVTDKRVIVYDPEHTSIQIYLKDIQSVKHIKRSFLSDEVVLTLTNTTNPCIAIYETTACTLVTETIESLIE